MEVEQSDAAKLGEIRQRWEKATPGPWRAWENNGRTFIDDGSPFHCVAKIATGWVDYGDANAQAIAEAPTDIAWLLALASRAVEAEARAKRLWRAYMTVQGIDPDEAMVALGQYDD